MADRQHLTRSGAERKLESEIFETKGGVEKSIHIVKRYKLVARDSHKSNRVIDVGGIPIRGKAVQVIAGPCSVETADQMHAAAAGARTGCARLMRDADDGVGLDGPSGGPGFLSGRRWRTRNQAHSG